VRFRWLVAFGVLATSASLFLGWGPSRSRWELRHGRQSRLVKGLALAFLFVPINTMAFHFIPKDKMNYARLESTWPATSAAVAASLSAVTLDGPRHSSRCIRRNWWPQSK